MNLNEMIGKLALLDVKAVEDILLLVRKRQRQYEALTDDFDYSDFYNYFEKEQLFIKELEGKVAEKDNKNSQSRIRDAFLKWFDGNPSIDNLPVGLVFDDYVKWSMLTGLEPMSRVTFGKELSKEGYVSKAVYKDGKTIRVYLLEK